MDDIGICIHANMPFIVVMRSPSAFCKLGVRIKVTVRFCPGFFDRRIEIKFEDGTLGCAAISNDASTGEFKRVLLQLICEGLVGGKAKRDFRIRW